MMQQIRLTEIILYVKDQERSRQFYEKLFRCTPALHVPGITEFVIAENCKLGLMPEDGISKLLTGKMPHPATGNGIPRCELYLYVDDIEHEFRNALDSGAILICPIAAMDWGDKVCYFSDPDAHIIAFAQKI